MVQKIFLLEDARILWVEVRNMLLVIRIRVFRRIVLMVRKDQSRSCQEIALREDQDLDRFQVEELVPLTFCALSRICFRIAGSMPCFYGSRIYSEPGLLWEACGITLSALSPLFYARTRFLFPGGSGAEVDETTFLYKRSMSANAF